MKIIKEISAPRIKDGKVGLETREVFNEDILGKFIYSDRQDIMKGEYVVGYVYGIEQTRVYVREYKVVSIGEEWYESMGEDEISIAKAVVKDFKVFDENVLDINGVSKYLLNKMKAKNKIIKPILEEEVTTISKKLNKDLMGKYLYSIDEEAKGLVISNFMFVVDVEEYALTSARYTSSIIGTHDNKTFNVVYEGTYRLRLNGVEDKNLNVYNGAFSNLIDILSDILEKEKAKRGIE